MYGKGLFSLFCWFVLCVFFFFSECVYIVFFFSLPLFYGTMNRMFSNTFFVVVVIPRLLVIVGVF